MAPGFSSASLLSSSPGKRNTLQSNEDKHSDPAVDPPLKDLLNKVHIRFATSTVTMEELDAEDDGCDNSVSDSETHGNIPVITFSKEEIVSMCAPWRNSVIIKLLGKSIKFHAMTNRLRKYWRTGSGFRVIDLPDDFFLVKLVSPIDQANILSGGPYKMFDHLLAVQPWERMFVPKENQKPKTAVWVHFEGATIDSFQEPVLLLLASKLGEPIKVNNTTLLATRGGFECVCVEMDLAKSFPEFVSLDMEGFPQFTDLICVYEGLENVCFTCGKFGHKLENCRGV